MRYWYIDSANYVSLLLLDKGYYDYDYERTEKPKVVVDWEKTIKSDEEVSNILAMFGMGPKVKGDEDLQQFILKEET